MMIATLTSKFYLIMFGRWVMRKRGKKSLIISKSILLATPLFFFEKHTQPKRMRCYGNFNGMEISSLVMVSHGSSNKKGVLIPFRWGLEYKLLSPEIVDDDGRHLILHIEIQGSPYILLTYHGPNDESNQVKVLRHPVNYSQLILMITYNLF